MTNQSILVQFAIIDSEFNTAVWLRRLYDDGKIITGGMLPPIGNIETFYVVVPPQDGTFDLAKTPIADELDLLVDNLSVARYLALGQANDVGEHFALWTNEETNDELTEPDRSD